MKLTTCPWKALMIPFHHTRSENSRPISIAEDRQEGSFNPYRLIKDYNASQAPLLLVSNVATNPNDSSPRIAAIDHVIHRCSAAFRRLTSIPFAKFGCRLAAAGTKVAVRG